MTLKRNVLVADPDERERSKLAEQLRVREEFDAAEAATAAGVLEAAETARHDVILLEMMLPDMDGRDVVRLLRRRGVHVPIIMVSALDSDADVILALDSGANDVVIKPFSLGVLLARIRAHLRQHEQSEDAAFTIGPYTFRPADKSLLHRSASTEVPLSEKESAILKFLYRAGDRVVSCETLYSEIWDHNAPLMTHTLQTHIYRLRQKIEDNPAHPSILVSESGGYRLVR